MAVRKNIDILRLKLVIEDLEIAQSELELGGADLNRILLEFREKISDEQKKDFNRQFLGITDPPVKNNAAGKSAATSEITVSKEKEKTGDIFEKNQAAWMKGIYKQIAQRTHPDKYIDFPIKEIKEKYTKIYIKAVDAFNCNKPGILLLCAHDAEVSYDHVEEAVTYIKNEINANRTKIKNIMPLLGYQWYHLEESKKLVFLENFIKLQGYKFDAEVAKEAIKRKILKRKTGQRPEKLFRVKRKQIK